MIHNATFIHSDPDIKMLINLEKIKQKRGKGEIVLGLKVE